MAKTVAYLTLFLPVHTVIDRKPVELNRLQICDTKIRSLSVSASKSVMDCLCKPVIIGDKSKKPKYTDAFIATCQRLCHLDIRDVQEMIRLCATATYNNATTIIFEI